jgi:hypothetical protein
MKPLTRPTIVKAATAADMAHPAMLAFRQVIDDGAVIVVDTVKLCAVDVAQLHVFLADEAVAGVNIAKRGNLPWAPRHIR